VANGKFGNLGIDFVSLEAGLLDEVVGVTQKYQDRCLRDKILPSSFWNKKTAAACVDNESVKPEA